MNLLLFLLTILGYRVEPTPARLQRKLTWREKLNRWACTHQYELLLLVTIMVMITFVLALIMFFPAMDVMNNRFEQVI